MRNFSIGFCLLLVTLAISGCKSKTPAEPPYVHSEGSVGFDLTLQSGLANLAAPTTWLGVHKSGGHSAQFKIELNELQPSNNGLSLGRGKFVAQSGSDATSLIAALVKELEAKKVPAQVTRTQSIEFDYAIIGENLSQAGDGGLNAKPGGNWIALKLFLGKGQDIEMFLNLNPVLHKGEFSIKDPDYGDDLVAELAKVL
jgi:hypothetical protein